MKNNIVTLVLLFVSTICLGQITITETKHIDTPEKRISFDSTKNFLGEFLVKSYKGQVLFVRPKPIISQSEGYDNFKKYPYDLNRVSISQEHYGHAAESSQYRTNYRDLAYKYFTVDSVVETRRLHVEYVFFLTARDNSADKCCFVYYPELGESFFPFLVVSHYNLLINEYVNKEFMTLRDEKLTIGRVIDISMNDNGELQCEFVIGKDTSYLTDMDILFYKNNIDAAEWIKLNGQNLSFSLECNNYIEKNEWNKLVKLYGIEMMKCVLTSSLRVGMPVALMYLSWGKPDRIHSSSYGDKQYVFGNDYVYVKNGRVTSWQYNY